MDRKHDVHVKAGPLSAVLFNANDEWPKLNEYEVPSRAAEFRNESGETISFRTARIRRATFNHHLWSMIKVGPW